MSTSLDFFCIFQKTFENYKNVERCTQMTNTFS